MPALLDSAARAFALSGQIHERRLRMSNLPEDSERFRNDLKLCESDLNLNCQKKTPPRMNALFIKNNNIDA